MEPAQLKKAAPLIPEIAQNTTSETALSPILKPSARFSKDAIRTSLKASTVDAFFGAVFSITTGGILLSNFLVELKATPVIFGILTSIPMLVNLIQPLGAYVSERTNSRFWHAIRTYGTSRLLWLILITGILLTSWGKITTNQLTILTLVIVFFSHLSGALGYASWLSWVATIVPRRLRGRYFGFRNSVINLTNLVWLLLAGFAVSNWPGGTLQGYAVVLFVAVLCGVSSLGCQYIQVDVNPKQQNAAVVKSYQPDQGVGGQEVPTLGNSATVPVMAVSGNLLQQKVISYLPSGLRESIFKNFNFLMFLLYFSFWMFAVNLSFPFFNFYLLNTLDLDVSWVTVYGSLQAGANLLMLIFWGRLADRIGNRTILLLVGLLTVATPLLWLRISVSPLDMYLWLPLLHIFIGSTWAGFDLCNNNLQIGVAPIKRQSIYFSIVAAVGGISGASGTILGGFIAQNPDFGGIHNLFILSSLCRLLSLTPLLFVQEARSQSFFVMIQGMMLRKKLTEV